MFYVVKHCNPLLLALTSAQSYKKFCQMAEENKDIVPILNSIKSEL